MSLVTHTISLPSLPPRRHARPTRNAFNSVSLLCHRHLDDAPIPSRLPHLSSSGKLAEPDRCSYRLS